MSARLHVSRIAAHIVLVEIDAPPVNALGEGLRARFEAALESIEADGDVRAIVITGRGHAFCAGDDLKEASRRKDDNVASLIRFGRLLDRVERLRPAVIAAVNGFAIGGGLELALCCDIRIASDKATFIGAGVNIGLMASTYRLPRLIGIGPAKAMLLTGSPADADAALKYGLVTQVHSPGALMNAALGLAERIAARAPLAVAASKRAIDQAYDLQPEEARALAERELARLAKTPDFQTRIEAFLARKPPAFTGLY